MAVVMEQPPAYMDKPVYTDSMDYAVNPQAVPLTSVVAAQPVTTVIAAQPVTTVINVIQSDTNHPRGIPRAWSTPLCGCFEDCCGCILAMLFPPCYACHVSSKMGEDCCAPCCLGQAAVLVMRAHIRGRHNIQGSLINDACTSCWCGGCTLCQLSRELDNIHSGRAFP